MKISTLALASALALSSLAATAQTTTPATTAPSSSQLRAAEQLLGALYTETSYNSTFDQILSAQLKANPTLQPYSSQMKAFMLKYMGWTVMRPLMADLYARSYTEAELQELAHFYQTPVGHKSITLMPTLMQQGMELGQHQLQAHMAEYQEIFKKPNENPEH